MAKRKSRIPKGARAVSRARQTIEKVPGVAPRVAEKPCESGPVRVMALYDCPSCGRATIAPPATPPNRCRHCGGSTRRIPGEIHETIG